MSMAPTDPELIQKPLAQTVPAIGGLDLVTSKINVNPGTLQDCMNYEVGKESGYRLASALIRWNGTTYSSVHRYLIATYDASNASASVYVGGEYTVESDYSGTTAKIKILKIDTGTSQIYFQIVSGDWAVPNYDALAVVSGSSYKFYETSDSGIYLVRKN